VRLFNPSIDTCPAAQRTFGVNGLHAAPGVMGAHQNVRIAPKICVRLFLRRCAKLTITQRSPNDQLAMT
jgi:hypothetical protein